MLGDLGIWRGQNPQHSAVVSQLNLLKMNGPKSDQKGQYDKFINLTWLQLSSGAGYGQS